MKKLLVALLGLLLSACTTRPTLVVGLVEFKEKGYALVTVEVLKNGNETTYTPVQPKDSPINNKDIAQIHQMLKDAAK